ncbi:hypothetical protein [Bacillus sp. ISL-7]|nr:hypothetical protein [Bacillus sp. ISL-7]
MIKDSTYEKNKQIKDNYISDTKKIASYQVENGVVVNVKYIEE